ncbi:hypothetical protein PG996_004636 [Apiospora saccharicola]|uniref:Uncharacterized protein n=1 Tax=Apiospora saccharicola TaxID=335842 RepID=A0ABR1W4N0_9PEZI
MAPAAGNTCSWYGTPASKKAKGEPASKKHKYEPVSKHSKEDEEDCAIEEGHSTPISVRELREAILLNKQAQQERLRARIPDPALHTVHGFVVEPRKAAAAAALAAPANHHRAAADSTSASMAEPSEVALADVNSIVRIHQAANQLAMQRNRLFNVVAADAAVANNTKPPAEARHVTFAPDPKQTKKKARSPPLAPPTPAPSQQKRPTVPAPAPATAPRHIGPNPADLERSPPWTKSYRCSYIAPDCTRCAEEKPCHRSCDGATAWCGGDKRFVPHMRGPSRRPDGREGKPIVEFDLEEVGKDSVKF